MRCIYATGSSCASNTYGNIAQHVKEHIKFLCPKDIFQYEYISSEIAYRNIRQQLGPNTRNHLVKRSKPYLIIQPIFSVPDEMYLFETPLTSNIDHLETGVIRENLFPIIKDKKEGLELLYRLNRDHIEFRITIIVSTLFQQIDLKQILLNTIYWNRPHAVRFPLEYVVPREIIRAFAVRKHLDIDQTNHTGVFLDYLNNFSTRPITYKTRTSTSKDEYFMYSNQQVILNFTDLETPEGSKKNMADDEFQINFNVNAEFNLPGMFFLIGDDRLREKTMGTIIHGDLTANQITFPLFTIENLYGNGVELNGFRKYRSSIVQMERNKDGNDITEFEGLISNDIKSILRRYQQSHNDIHTLASVSLYKNAVQLVEGKDYTVDWGKFTITTFYPSLEDTYRFILYLNTVKINEIIVELTDAAQIERPAFKPKI